MKSLYISSRNKFEIVLSLFFESLFFPLMLFVLSLSISSQMIHSIFILLISWVPTFVIVLISRRFYVLKIFLNENKIEISYLFYFKKRQISIFIQDIEVAITPLKYELKYFEIKESKKTIIKQFPFLDWNVSRMEKIKNSIYISKPN
jgi:hypothetical protein